MINIRNFFEIDTNDVPVKKPINRNAFTPADVAYKVKCIKAMLDLGMIVTIDKIGNICGTIPGKSRIDKSVLCTSHTDSVDNGGQFDGPLGIYAALKTAENIVNSGKQNEVNYKVVICACEESTRFKGKACLGSKYLRGDDLDFQSTISREGISLETCVAEYKKELFKQLKEAGLGPIQEVDKVIQENEIVTAIEGHIEQADELREQEKSIGICTSITAPYRLKADVSDINTASQFICNLHETAKKPNNLGKYRATVPEFSIKNQYDENDLHGKKVATIRVDGKSNHSGATPMARRQDAVYGAARLIQDVASNPDIKVLETCTPNWGPNQINDCCYVKFAFNPEMPPKELLDLFLVQKDTSHASNVFFKLTDDIPKQNKENGLYVDIRQQIGMNPKLTTNMIFDTLKDMIGQTKTKFHMNITAMGKPYQTNADLVNLASEICENEKISYEVLKSWAGHDLATLTKDELARTILLFCASIGGSHNPDETTTLEAINDLVKVESKLARERISKSK